MNKRMIFYILGKMMGVEGIVLLIPAFVSLLYQEKSGFSFLIVSAVLILIYFEEKNQSQSGSTVKRDLRS